MNQQMSIWEKVESELKGGMNGQLAMEQKKEFENLKIIQMSLQEQMHDLEKLES